MNRKKYNSPGKIQPRFVTKKIMDLEKYYSMDDVCLILDRSRPRIYQLITEHKLHPVKMFGRNFFLKTDIHQYKNDHEKRRVQTAIEVR